MWSFVFLASFTSTSWHEAVFHSFLLPQSIPSSSTMFCLTHSSVARHLAYFYLGLLWIMLPCTSFCLDRCFPFSWVAIQKCAIARSYNKFMFNFFTTATNWALHGLTLYIPTSNVYKRSSFSTFLSISLKSRLTFITAWNIAWIRLELAFLWTGEWLQPYNSFLHSKFMRI